MLSNFLKYISLFGYEYVSLRRAKYLVSSFSILMTLQITHQRLELRSSLAEALSLCI